MWHLRCDTPCWVNYLAPKLSLNQMHWQWHRWVSSLECCTTGSKAQRSIATTCYCFWLEPNESGSRSIAQCELATRMSVSTKVDVGSKLLQKTTAQQSWSRAESMESCVSYIWQTHALAAQHSFSVQVHTLMWRTDSSNPYSLGCISLPLIAHTYLLSRDLPGHWFSAP